jgi:hypothetical protein
MPTGVICLPLLGTGAILWTWKTADCRAVASAVLESSQIHLVIESDVVVDALQSASVPPPTLVDGHTHPTAAGCRTSARHFAELVAMKAGADLYSVEMSKSDQRKGIRGSRQWRWNKDTKADNRLDVQKETDFGWICDVDYYIDMPALLANNPRPYLLYSCVPGVAATGGTDDIAFCFDEQGVLLSDVSGSGHYEHLLWDYGQDATRVSATFLGIPYRTTTYAIERKQVAENRQVVALVPLRQFGLLGSILARWLLEEQPLKRFDPVVVGKDGSKFISFTVMKKGVKHITVSKPSSYVCATVPCDVSDAVAGVARLGTTNLMLPTVESHLPRECGRGAAVVMTEYHRAQCPDAKHCVFPVVNSVRSYSYNVSNYDQDAKPKLQGFMSPILHAAYCPVNETESERQAVKGRIDALKQQEPRFHSFREQCIREFADFVVSGCRLSPVQYEVIEQKQVGAAQRLSLRKATVQGRKDRRIVKSFIKAEAYAGVKDPRIITTFDDKVKLEMGHFTLALAQHCKRFKWYGPGKTPVEIADRVAEICSDASFVNLSDYTRMDGTITETIRGVDRAIYMKAFQDYRTDLNELLKLGYNNTGYLPRGTKYEQGTSQGSGNPDTSNSQTLRAAFVSYFAYRNVVSPTGRKFSPQEAFDHLGMHNGDDGIDADLPQRNFDWAAGKCGLLLEAAIVQRGQRGVNFLARYYSPQVWYGCNNSMCDIKRQLSKFHTTVRLPDNVTPEAKLVEKSRAYLATDRNTPIIGTLCKHVIRLSNKVFVLNPKRKTPLPGVAHWWSKFDESVQFPNKNIDGWMDVELDHMLPELDRSIFDKWLVTTRTLSQITQAPLCVEPRATPPTSVDVVVDNTVVHARQDPQVDLPPAKAAETRNRAKRRRRRKVRATTNKEKK